MKQKNNIKILFKFFIIILFSIGLCSTTYANYKNASSRYGEIKVENKNIIISDNAEYIDASNESISSNDEDDNDDADENNTDNYASRIPQHINPLGEKVIIVNPKVHIWGAYDAEGNLVRAGLATAGSHWCRDLKSPCRTKVGTFRIKSLGSPQCRSSIFPLPHGGAPMPFCMFFHGGQALHGSPPGHVVEGNVSHGCVRLTVEDARWIRYNFAEVGTLVIIQPYK